MPFIGKVLVSRKCSFYQAIERLGNKCICQLTAFFVRFDVPPELFSFFDKELISIKNRTFLMPDLNRKVLWSNTRLTRAIGACYNK